MLASLKTALSSLLIMFGAGQDLGNCWYVDKSNVARGGCVTVVVQTPCNESGKLMLQINNGNIVDLFNAGPSYHKRTSRLPGREDTLVLLYLDLGNPESLEEVETERGTFRPTPIFHRVGTMSLTLYAEKESLGTVVVVVTPEPPDATDAIALLRPRIGQHHRGQRDELLWLQVITDSAAHKLTDREIALLRAQLPIIKEHPDWAEIAEMALARAEAKHYAQSLVEDFNGESRLREDVVSIEMPVHIREAQARKVTHPFAKAIQDEIEQSLTLLSHLKSDREQRIRLRNSE